MHFYSDKQCFPPENVQLFHTHSLVQLTFENSKRPIVGLVDKFIVPLLPWWNNH